MLEQLIYKNHLNEELSFGKGGIYVDTNELHDYSWSVVTRNNRIARLEKTVKTKKLPIKIIAESTSDATSLKNKLMEVCEKDCIAGQPGKIIIGKYYITGYVTESKKTAYLYSGRCMEATLTITTDNQFWTTDKVQTFVPASTTESLYMDYPFDYPFDYLSSYGSSYVLNPSFADSNFMLSIYGPVIYPKVHIAGHEYSVNCDVGNNEYLVIDSRAKTVTLIKENGTQENHFADRNRNSYIFKKIPSGESTISWAGDFSMSLTVYDERSEPKWT